MVVVLHLMKMIFFEKIFLFIILNAKLTIKLFKSFESLFKSELFLQKIVIV